MNISTTLTFIFLSSFIVYIEAHVHHFFNGRPNGGFLGLPGDDILMGATIDSHLPPARWYYQKLDHFDGADTKYWNQRYFTNDSFYVPGGPLFVHIGAEAALTGAWLVSGAWLDYARRYRAYCVQLEHRYYGLSQPTPDLSVENLKFLSSEQALADLAVFITDLKDRVSFPKIIVFGGSYGGILAAGLRLKYPHLVDGVIASSAALLPLINFKQYLEVVDSSLKYFYPSGDCNTAIAAATDIIRSNLTTLVGRQNLKKLFKLCDDIDPAIENDIANLFLRLASNINGIVQYNMDNMRSTTHNITIDTLCGIMTDTSVGDPLQRYAQINSLILRANSYSCLGFKYSKMIDYMKQYYWNSSAVDGGNRQWTYQTCTEFGFYASSDSDNQPFGHEFPIDFLTQQCADIFGESFNISLISAAVRRTTLDYGALGIKISRALFTNGNIDPWHVLGVLKDLNPDAKAILINGTAHCADTYPSSSRDPPQLTQSRARISITIGLWLQP